MIVDRRLVALAVVAAAAVVVLVIVVARSTEHRSAPVPTTLLEHPPHDPPDSADSSTTLEPESSSTSAVAGPPTTSAVTTTLPADAPVEDLVAARRPIPAAGPVDVEDGHDHPSEVDTDEAAGDVAAAVAVALWSWRFDDQPAQLLQALTGIASPGVIAAITPSVDELERRRAVGEVAWAIVMSSAPAPGRRDDTGLVIDVTAAQHVTTSTSPETIASRSATMRLQHVDGRWQVVEVVAGA